MPNIRTTHVSLLVDREVGRNVRTTTVAFLVDCIDTLRWIDNFNQTDEFKIHIDDEPDGPLSVHAVEIGLFAVNKMGQMIDKNTASMFELASSQLANLVIPNQNVPNSAGYPTVKQFLEAESADDYVLDRMLPTMTLTRKVYS